MVIQSLLERSKFFNLRFDNYLLFAKFIIFKKPLKIKFQNKVFRFIELHLRKGVKIFRVKCNNGLLGPFNKYIFYPSICNRTK